MKEILAGLLDVLRWLFGRPRLVVRIIRDEVGPNKPGLTFEAENRGGTATSLLPEVKVTFYYLSRLRVTKARNRYFVREVDRRLEPFSARMLSASAEYDLDYQDFSWYRTYRFRPSQGIGTKVRIRNALLEPISLLRFLGELSRFRLTGRVPPDQHKSIDDMDRLRREIGPH